MTVATSDGSTLWGFRYSSEGRSRSLFYSTRVDTLREQHPDVAILQQALRRVEARRLGAARRSRGRLERGSGVALRRRPGGPGRAASVRRRSRRRSDQVAARAAACPSSTLLRALGRARSRPHRRARRRGAQYATTLCHVGSASRSSRSSVPMTMLTSGLQTETVATAAARFPVDERDLLDEEGQDPGDRKGVELPALEHRSDAAVAVDLHRRLAERGREPVQHSGARAVQRRLARSRSPPAGDEQRRPRSHANTTTAIAHSPRGSVVDPLGGLPDHREHRAGPSTTTAAPSTSFRWTTWFVRR